MKDHKSQTRNDFRCYYCDAPGHNKSQCRKLKTKTKAEIERAQQRINGDANTTTTTNGDITIICDDLSLACQDSQWVIDYGGSYHVTSHRDAFSTYSDGEFGKI